MGRLSFQGPVEIEDADADAQTILIDVEKHGQSPQQIDEITVDQTLFDVGHGTIFVLQLVTISFSLSQLASRAFKRLRRWLHVKLKKF